MTPKRFKDNRGVEYPSTRLDDRAGVETRKGWYQLADGRAQVARLPAVVFVKVKSKAKAGEKSLAAGDASAAFAAFSEALNLLPEPRQRWNAAGWLLVAMGECCIRLDNHEAALGPLQDSIICPGTLGNPWVHLRLGQTQHELKNMDRAADELARAYMGGGREVFEGQDAKYFRLVEKVLKPPPGMSRLP